MRARRISTIAMTTTFLTTMALVLTGAASAMTRLGDNGGLPVQPTAPVPVTGGGGSGLDWVSLGVGAAIAVGSMAVLAAATFALFRRRRSVALQ